MMLGFKMLTSNPSYEMNDMKKQDHKSTRSSMNSKEGPTKILVTSPFDDANLNLNRKGRRYMKWGWK